MQEGLVIVNYGRQVVVENGAGTRTECLVKGRKLQPVCGDRVRWQTLADGTHVIGEVLPRKSLLFRYDSRHQQQPLAANLDQLLIVTAPEPALETFLLDKYLVAASATDLEPVIVLNKSDLLEAAQDPEPERLLNEYAELGYRGLRISALRKNGFVALNAVLRDRTSALVGASGTGKSSIVKSLLPGEDIRIGEISTARDEGRHTTTRSTLYHLAGGGDLVDSPGVRDFMLWPMPVAELRRHFVEFREPALRCRFADCAHLNEPGCAVLMAVDKGAILKRRYDSYQGLVKIMAAQYRAY